MNFYDVAYTLGLAGSSPLWALWPPARTKVLTALRQRMGDVPGRPWARPAIMIHAVSLGEVNATRAMVTALRTARPDCDIVISTTTTTGFARATELYAQQPNCFVIRYPLDFSSAVLRVLDAMRPSLVVLMELEIWPNFVQLCAQRKIPVLVANGRLTVKSFDGYRRIRPLVRSMFRRLTRVCVQDETYAQRFEALGVPSDRITVTGTMKFDTAQVADHVDGDEELAHELGIQRDRETVWVCGSTGPGEEELILQQYRQLVTRFSRLRLVLVPRKPERFDDVARVIEQMRFKVLRRSIPTLHTTPGPLPPVILGDTMGELRKFYSLADVVFVGRTLVDLGPSQHGSDMIEPAALAKPTVVGMHTGNFLEPMRRFLEMDAILEVDDAPTLGQTVSVLISTPTEAKAMGTRAQDVVTRHQGATQRHVEIILRELSKTLASDRGVVV